MSTHQWALDNWSDQSVRWFRLEIPASDLDKKSKMSLDYKKYGYQKIEENIDYIPKGTYSVSMGSDLLLWKNEHMDVFQATELEETLENLNRQNFKLNCWELSGPNMPASLSERLEITYDEHRVLAKENKKIKRYIEQKLGTMC
jgi:hypothetical protein